MYTFVFSNEEKNDNILKLTSFSKFNLSISSITQISYSRKGILSMACFKWPDALICSINTLVLNLDRFVK